MQYLDLVRDAQYAFDLPELPPNVVQTSHPLIGKNYAEEDYRLQKNCSSTRAWDPDQRAKQLERRAAKKQKKNSTKEVEDSSETAQSLQDGTAQGPQDGMDPIDAVGEDVGADEVVASADRDDGEGAVVVEGEAEANL